MLSENQKKLLNILFNPNEEICISNSKYGFMSIPLQDVLSRETVTLQPQTEKQRPLTVSPYNIALVSINPVKGSRHDKNVTSFRTFMIELDTGSLFDQMSYIKKLKMPYSACIFSGNKSLHFAITLDRDLPSEKEWKFFAEWILTIVAKADQQAKNPTRGLRFADSIRFDTAKKQTPIYLGSRVSLEELKVWLSGYPGLAPIERVKKRPSKTPLDVDLRLLPLWAQERLIEAQQLNIDKSKGRNNTWYSLAYECALLGWDEDQIVSVLGNFFEEESDFTKTEWEIAIKSAIKKVYDLSLTYIDES